MTTTEMKVDWVEAGKLIPHPSNPRQGDIGVIKESIALNGWHGVIVAQSSTSHVLAGNHRMEAALDIFRNGWDNGQEPGAPGYVHVAPGDAGAVGLRMRKGKSPELLLPVHYRDVDDTTALRILLMDNRAGDLAQYDEPALLDLLLQIEMAGRLVDAAPGAELAGTGYTPEDAEQLRMGLEVTPVEPWNNTPEHNLERYLATDLRQITVIMESAEYQPVIDTMLTIMEREKMETNKDVFLHLLRLDSAGADVDERIAAARALAENTARANGDAQEATSEAEDGSEVNTAEIGA